MKYVKLFEEFTKTIGGLHVKPNDTINQVLKGEEEDERLLKIRQFKGTVKDYKNYWDDRINQRNSTTIN